MKNNVYLLFLLLFPFAAFAQIIPLANPSFEDFGRHSHVPRGWYDCGFPGESPPDTQPDPNNYFQVSKNPHQGRTYLGLVARDNNTWESVSGKLPQKMEKDTCYTFSIFAARSETYISTSRVTEEQANYNTPLVLRVHGGFDYCDKQELLAESDLITNTKWEELQFAFQPLAKYTHIVIEAFYRTPTLFPYNGNVLLDDVQLIKGCDAAAAAIRASGATMDVEPIDIEEVIKKQAVKKEEVKKKEIPVEKPIEIATPIPEKPRVEVKKEPRKPAVLPAALPKDASELTQVLGALGKELRFLGETANLEPHDFTLTGQAYKSTNQYLAFIAKAMQQFPDYRLVISVDGKDDMRYVKTINLQDQLLSLGLDEDHCTVYPYNDLDRRKQWLSSNIDGDILLQIMPIKK